MTTITDEDMTCGWLITVPSNNPEPDFPSDCWREVECGEPIETTTHQVGGVTVHLQPRYALCSRHLAAMTLPEDEFEAVSERYDGRAWS